MSNDNGCTYHTAPRALDKHGPEEIITAWKKDPDQSFDMCTGVCSSQDKIKEDLQFSSGSIRSLFCCTLVNNDRSLGQSIHANATSFPKQSGLSPLRGVSLFVSAN